MDIENIKSGKKMNEKTSSDYFNGIDAYRVNLSESGVYISKSLPQYSNELYLKITPILLLEDFPNSLENEDTNKGRSMEME